MAIMPELQKALPYPLDRLVLSDDAARWTSCEILGVIRNSALSQEFVWITVLPS